MTTKLWSSVKHPQSNSEFLHHDFEIGGKEFTANIDHNPARGLSLMLFSRRSGKGNAYSLKGDMGVADARSVMMKMVPLVHEHLHGHKPNVLRFSADGAEPSRVKMYDWLAKRVHRIHPDYVALHSDDMEEGDTHVHRNYYLVHKDHVKQMQADKVKQGRPEPQQLAREDDSEFLTLHHFSTSLPWENAVVDPEKFSTARNHYSKAEYRESQFGRSFFYVDPQEKEGMVYGEHFTAKVPKSKVYDLRTDPEGHLPKARSISHLLHTLEEAGYHGARYNNGRDIVTMWKPVPVERVPPAAPEQLSRDPKWSKMTGVQGEGRRSNFTVGNGRKYSAFMHQKAPGDYGFQFGLQEGENQQGITGTGHAKEVFGHVIGLLHQHLHDTEPKAVSFSADSSEPSRVKLYNYLISRVGRLHPDYEGVREAQPGGSLVKYSIKRKEKPMQLAASSHDEHALQALHMNREGQPGIAADYLQEKGHPLAPVFSRLHTGATLPGASISHSYYSLHHLGNPDGSYAGTLILGLVENGGKWFYGAHLGVPGKVEPVVPLRSREYEALVKHYGIRHVQRPFIHSEDEPPEPLHVQLAASKRNFLHDLAEGYHEKHKDRFGLDIHPTDGKFVFDPELGKRTAAVFDKLKHQPDHPFVKKAYGQMKAELLAQYHHLTKAGIKFEPWDQAGQPYKDSKDMQADVLANKRIKYFKTAEGFGSDARFNDHPLMEEVPHMPGVKFNDLLRGVHDVLAHAKDGHQFGPKGEFQAWGEHARLFSPLARAALTTETHGQNSWVNFGPHGDKPVTERPFADQKAAVLPKSVTPKLQLSRPVESDLSQQGMARKKLLLKLLLEAKLKPVAFGGSYSLHTSGMDAGSYAEVVHNNEPDAVSYVGHYYGLLNGQGSPDLHVFHQNDTGNHSLTVFDSPLPTDKLYEALAPALSSPMVRVIPKDGFNRVAVINLQNSGILKDANAANTQQFRGDFSTLRGRGGESSSSREGHRNAIQAYERQYADAGS